MYAVVECSIEKPVRTHSAMYQLAEPAAIIETQGMASIMRVGAFSALHVPADADGVVLHVTALHAFVSNPRSR
jgi:hypothetical protein